MAADYNLGTARGKLEIDASGAEAGAKKGEQAVEGFTGKLTKAGPGLVKVGAAVGGAGALIGAAFVGAVNEAANFEKQMSAIQAVSGATVPQMDSVRKKALQLGADTAFSAGEAGQAMEELIKAGIPIPDVLNGAADATVALAAAGEVALPVAATIASNAMNQFSLSAQQMPKVADLIAGAANASAIDVTDFGHSLSQVGAVANLVGLSFEDTAVAIAEMGNAGIKGSDAGTSLKTMLSNLQPTTDKARGTMEALGIITKDAGNRFYDAQGKLKPLAQIQDILQKSTAGLSADQKQMALQTIFGSDAIRAAAILTKNGAKGYTEMSKGIHAVTAEQVAAARQNNFQGDLEKLKGSLSTVAIQIGTILLPALRKLTQMLTSVVNWFSNLSDGQKKTIVTIVGIIGAVLLVVGAFIAFAGAIGLVLGALAPLAAVIGIGVGALLGWIAVIALIVVAVVVLAVLIIKNWDKIKAFTVKIWNAIVAFFKSVWGSIVSFFQSVGSSIAGFFSGLWNGIKSVAMTVWNAIAAFFKTIFNAILGFIMGWINMVKAVIQTGLNIILGIWNAIWGVFGGLITAVFNLILAVINLVMKLIMFAIVTALKAIWAVVSTILTAIKNFFVTIFNFILKIATAVWNAVYGAISSVVNRIKAIVVSVFNAVKGFITTVFNAVAGFVSSIWNSIYSKVAGPVGRIKDFIVNTFNSAKNLAVSAFTSMASAIGSWIQKAYDKVSGVVQKIRDLFAGAGKWLINAGKNIIQGLIDGITSMINKVTDKLKELTDKIPDWKGPEKRDKNLLKPAGALIMEGFNDALAAGVSDVRRTLTGVTGALPTFVPVFADAVGEAGGSTTLGAPAPVAAGNGPTIVLHSYNPVGKTDAETLSDEVTRLATLGVL